MNSKTVYIIGSGKPSAIEQAIKELEAKGFEPVVVESIEDIPIEARLSSIAPLIQQIHEYKIIKRTPMPEYYKDKKRKGHERPYKYHP